MKKKFLLLMITFIGAFMLSGCLEDFEDSYEGEYDPEYDQQMLENSNTDKTELESGYEISVTGEDGKMSINRAEKKDTPMGDKGTWSVFIYLCGTDLESQYGAAVGDIEQMTKAEGNENIKFIIQTGGTSEWTNSSFNAGSAERYVVQSGNLEKVDEVEIGNMGSASNLEEFLKWGVKTYPAEKMGVVFWDHGSGSINGVCFDEINENDSLSLSEMNSAFSKVYADMTDQFEFIGFDACLMGTVETANMAATYARYMYGSEETEPGTGWDYTAIGSYLSKNPDSNGGDVGKVVADSFYKECETQSQENECTFTIVDLAKFDDFAVAFNDYSKSLYEACQDQNGMSNVVRGIVAADNFGGNNKSEGYTNMVDLGGILSECSDSVDGSKVQDTLKNCIVYNINGSNHPDAKGLAIYYPLQVMGSSELKIFSDICISPYYLSLVDMVAKGYSEEGYSNDEIFNEEGNWECDGTDTTDSEESQYFDYADEDSGKESEVITFENEPYVNEEGVYCFKLDENGLDYTADVTAYIYMDNDNDGYVELGETLDVNADWETGEFSDYFDGYWFALPDGQLLATYVADIGEDFVVYTSPIYLNGEETNLRIRQTDEETVIEGAWDGIDENGAAARCITPLKDGDKIVPAYFVIKDDDSEEERQGDEYTWSDGDIVDYAYLPSAYYSYGFNIDDVYGDYYVSELVTFFIDENGEVSFVEE